MLQRMVSHDEMQGCHIESVVVAVEVHDSIHPVGDDQVEARETDTSQNVVVVAADPSVMLRHCYLVLDDDPIVHAQEEEVAHESCNIAVKKDNILMDTEK